MTQPTPHTPTRRQRLLEKALEEISIGDPEKAETYIELVLADEKGGHTPGPWHVYDATLVYAACGLRIADCDWDGQEDEMLSLETQEQANARLIAAAPDLLQATEGILQWWDTTASQGRDGVEPSAFKEARGAIAKAQGGAA